jgi:hypothetical protein
LGDYSYRHVHQIDAVPHSNVIFKDQKDLKHVPNEIWENQPGKFKVCATDKSQPWIEDPSCSISKAIPLELSYFISAEKPPTNTLSFFSDLKDKIKSTVKKGVDIVKKKVEDRVSTIKLKLQYVKDSLFAHALYFGYNIKNGEDNLGC